MRPSRRAPDDRTASSRRTAHLARGAADRRSAPATGANPNATIWLFHILGRAQVAVGNGENSGHTLTYRNIVRDVKAVGMWKGQAVSLDLPRAEMTSAPYDAIAVVVQQSGYGRILGAAEVSRASYAIAW